MSGLRLREAAVAQYVVFPLEGEPTLICACDGPHLEAARRHVFIKDVRSPQGVTAQVGAIICLGQPASVIRQFWDEVMLPGYWQLEPHLRPGVPLVDIQQAGAYFRQKGAQSAPLLLHGLDIEAGSPWVFVDQIQAEAFEETLQPGMVVLLRPNPITANGRWGMCLSRTYAIAAEGLRLLTDYPLELVFV